MNHNRAKTAAPLVRRLVKNDAGNVAIIFALLMVPLFSALGAAVDFSRGYLVQRQLSSAIDAAALAVGSSTSQDQAELTELAQKYFDANYKTGGVGDDGTVTLDINDGVISISAVATVPTYILGLAGYNVLDVAATAEVVKDSKALEIAMVLDNTGSMGWNGKIDALKDASKSLVSILFGSETVHPKLKIGLVPFSQGVNVGPSNADASWMDVNAQSSIHGENFSGSTNIFDLYNQIDNASWAGCVESRPAPYDTNDAPPSAGNPDTLFVPYFYPDEPDDDDGFNGYYNDYLDDGVGGSAEDRQRSTGKYTNASVSGSGPNYGCSIPPLTPLINVRSTVDDAIDDFVASGYTHIPLGLVWGWRMLSPSEPLTEGVAYGDEDTQKALILLTDGYNTIPSENTHNNSRYSAYGFVAEGRLGTTNYNSAVAQLDPRTATVCEAIKAQNIRLYTITFQLSDGPVKDLMRDCATEPGLYFDSPSNEQLQVVFKAIATDLSNLRISK